MGAPSKLPGFVSERYGTVAVIIQSSLLAEMLSFYPRHENILVLAFISLAAFG